MISTTKIKYLKNYVGLITVDGNWEIMHINDLT